MTYTMRGAQVLVEALMRRQNRELATLTIAVRQSQGTDGKLFEKFVNTLEGND